MWKNGSVEERLFRAALACAFDCGLQPRPALKGIHPPAVAAMNGRSSTLTQALVLRARRNTRQEETQVRHRFVVPSIRAKALSRQKYPGRCVSTAFSPEKVEDQDSGNL